MVTLQLDRPRTLRITYRSIVELKRQHGLNLMTTDEQAFEDPETVAAVLWAALIHEDKALTVEDVVDLIELDRLPIVVEAIADAIVESMPGQDDGRPFAMSSAVGGSPPIESD